MKGRCHPQGHSHCVAPTAALTAALSECDSDHTLGYVPSLLRSGSIPIRVTQKRYQPLCGWYLFVERVKGIEPSLQAWEARVLPLNYTRVFVSTKFDEIRQKSTIFSATSEPSIQLSPRQTFDNPPTYIATINICFLL